MFCIKLTIIAGVGKITLVVCHLLLTIAEIDSESNSRNRVTTLKPEESTIIPGVEGMNINVTEEFFESTPRKKKNLINMVKKYYHFSLNTTKSTCTPFFIPRSLTAHRKTTRLKKPNRFNMVHTYNNAENKHILQNENKGSSKHLTTQRHSLTPSLAKNNLELSTTEKQRNHNFLNSLCLSKGPTIKVTDEDRGAKAIKTGRSNGTTTKNSAVNALSTEGKLYRSKVKTKDVLNSETLHSNVVTLKSFTAVTQENQIEKSPMEQMYFTNTTTYVNTPVGRTNIGVKKFHLKDLFHFTKAPPLTSFESNGIATTFELTKVLEPLKPTVRRYFVNGKPIENNSIAQQETEYFIPSTGSPNTFKFKKIFCKHQKSKHFSSNVSTESSEKMRSLEPVLEETSDVLETKISSSSNQRDDLLSDSSSIRVPSETRKYLYFRKMLHREQGTTVNKITNLSAIGQGITVQTNGLDYNFLSNPSFTNTLTPSENEIQTDTLFRQKNKNLTFETTVLDQSQEEKTFISKLGSDDKSNMKKENSKTTMTHNPFKVKFLMRFRSPLSTIDSNSDHESFNMSGLSSKITKPHQKDPSCGKEQVTFLVASTKPVNSQNNMSSTFKVPDKFEYVSINHKSHNKDFGLSTKSLQDDFLNGDKNKSDSGDYGSNENKHSTLQWEDPQSDLKLENRMGYKTHKSHVKNESIKHHTRKPINNNLRVSHKPGCCYKPNKNESFSEIINITVSNDNSRQFRDWIIGKTRSTANIKSQREEEECRFRWCFLPTLNESLSIKKPSYHHNYSAHSPDENILESAQTSTELFSNFSQGKKFKKFFHFKTSQMISEYNTTEVLTPDDVVKTVTSPKTSQTKQYHREDQELYSNIYSDFYSLRGTATPEPRDIKPVNGSAKVQPKSITVKAGLNSNSVMPNISIKGHRRKKVKELFDKLHPTKKHALNNTFVLNNYPKNSSSLLNRTVLLNPDYADYVETKKLKKHPNKTVDQNASDVNDTSFNVLALVMKPLDSLVSVFKAHSPNSVTKIADVNVTDLKNGSLSNHFHPPNTSIVIFAVNNTNAASSDIHESKLALALDVLGGVYHCMFNSFVQVRPKDVHFYLYTRNSPEEPEELFLPLEPSDANDTENSDLPDPVFETDTTSELPLDKREVGDEEENYEDYEFEALNPAESDIQSKWFNIRAETKVLIHGYLQDYQTDIMVSMKEAYLAQGPYNVLVVDWSVLVGDSSCYPMVASRGLRQVGGLLAQLLNRLAEAGVSPSSIHIVGFSLGAHVAGHAGTFLNHGLVSRITGLDPALPYVPMEPDVSLDSDDAVFVDIIHSAAGLLGQSGPMGHVDFYPNGGSQQPGCEASSLSCSHRRAALYFIESIGSDSGFQATKCDSWHHFQAENCSDPAKVFMGEPCPTNISGKYYLFTGYKSPFALQPEEHVKVKKSLLLDLFYDSEDL